MLRRSDNPPSRFPEGRSLEEDTGLWCVIHTKSRQEKALAHDLIKAGVSYYLPLYEKRTRRRDNKKLRKSILPLFPNYLAAAVVEEQYDMIFKTGRICTILPVAEQETFVQELSQVRGAIETGLDMEILRGLQPGQPVVVRAGPMLGLEGEIIRKKGTTLFAIRVQMFNQAVCVEIDEAYLEARP